MNDNIIFGQSQFFSISTQQRLDTSRGGGATTNTNRNTNGGGLSDGDLNPNAQKIQNSIGDFHSAPILPSEPSRPLLQQGPPAPLTTGSSGLNFLGASDTGTSNGASTNTHTSIITKGPSHGELNLSRKTMENTRGTFQRVHTSVTESSIFPQQGPPPPSLTTPPRIQASSSPAPSNPLNHSLIPISPTNGPLHFRYDRPPSFTLPPQPSQPSQPPIQGHGPASENLLHHRVSSIPNPNVNPSWPLPPAPSSAPPQLQSYSGTRVVRENATQNTRADTEATSWPPQPQYQYQQPQHQIQIRRSSTNTSMTSTSNVHPNPNMNASSPSSSFSGKSQPSSPRHIAPRSSFASTQSSQFSHPPLQSTLGGIPVQSTPGFAPVPVGPTSHGYVLGPPQPAQSHSQPPTQGQQMQAQQQLQLRLLESYGQSRATLSHPTTQQGHSQTLIQSHPSNPQQQATSHSHPPPQSQLHSQPQLRKAQVPQPSKSQQSQHHSPSEAQNELLPIRNALESVWGLVTSTHTRSLAQERQRVIASAEALKAERVRYTEAAERLPTGESIRSALIMAKEDGRREGRDESRMELEALKAEVDALTTEVALGRKAKADVERGIRNAADLVHVIRGGEGVGGGNASAMQIVLEAAARTLELARREGEAAVQELELAKKELEKKDRELDVVRKEAEWLRGVVRVADKMKRQTEQERLQTLFETLPRRGMEVEVAAIGEKDMARMEEILAGVEAWKMERRKEEAAKEVMMLKMRDVIKQLVDVQNTSRQTPSPIMQDEDDSQIKATLITHKESATLTASTNVPIPNPNLPAGASVITTINVDDIAELTPKPTASLFGFVNAPVSQFKGAGMAPQKSQMSVLAPLSSPPFLLPSSTSAMGGPRATNTITTTTNHDQQTAIPVPSLAAAHPQRPAHCRPESSANIVTQPQLGHYRRASSPHILRNAPALTRLMAQATSGPPPTIVHNDVLSESQTHEEVQTEVPHPDGQVRALKRSRDEYEAESGEVDVDEVERKRRTSIATRNRDRSATAPRSIPAADQARESSTARDSPLQMKREPVDSMDMEEEGYIATHNEEQNDENDEPETETEEGCVAVKREAVDDAMEDVDEPEPDEHTQQEDKEEGEFRTPDLDPQSSANTSANSAMDLEEGEVLPDPVADPPPPAPPKTTTSKQPRPGELSILQPLVPLAPVQHASKSIRKQRPIPSFVRRANQAEHAALSKISGEPASNSTEPGPQSAQSNDVASDSNSARLLASTSTTISTASTMSPPTNPPTSQHPTTSMTSSAPLPARKKGTKLGISHVDLLYKMEGQNFVCRMCLTRSAHASKRARASSTASSSSHGSNRGSKKQKPYTTERFPADAPWDTLIGHCRREHPMACAELEKMSPSQVAEMKERMTGARFGR